MSDLIDRREAVAHLQRIREASADTTGYNEGFADGLDFCISFISTLPSAEPERKTEKWKKAYADHEAFGVRKSLKER